MPKAVTCGVNPAVKRRMKEKLMLIGEIAKRVGITKEAVRHYVDIGLLKPTPKQAGSRIYNDFSDRDLERLKWVIMGKSLGFTLTEIEHYLTLFMRDDLSRDQARAMFQEKLDEVDAKIAHLQHIRDQLAEKLRTRYA